MGGIQSYSIVFQNGPRNVCISYYKTEYLCISHVGNSTSDWKPASSSASEFPGDGGSEGGGESGGVAGGNWRSGGGEVRNDKSNIRRGKGNSDGGDSNGERAADGPGGGGEGGGGGIASASQGEQRIISSGQTWQIGPRARWGVRMASMSLSFNKSASQHVKHR